jgi:HSP20 family protein
MCKLNSSLNVQKLPVTRREMGGQTHWIPNTDVYVTDDGLVVKVELAGMRREDLELAVEGNRLLITGQRPDGCRVPGIKFLVMEINYGSFECVIEIPPGYDLSQAKAAYQNGFLRVDVPVAAHTPTKTVLVPVSDGK